MKTTSSPFKGAPLLFFVLAALVLIGAYFVARSYQRASKNHGDWLGSGIEAAFNGDYGTAVPYLSQAAKLDPTSVFAYFNRGYAYMGAHDYDKAIADFNHIIELHPKLAATYVNRGSCYDSKGDPARALADYDRAIQLDPFCTVAFYDRGMLHFHQGDDDAAIADFTQAIHPQPDSAQASADESDTERQAISGAVIDPAPKHLYFQRGLAYENKGDHDKALADYDQAIKDEPTYSPPFIARGVIYAAQGAYDKALADYTQAIQLDPKNAEALYDRGTAYYNMSANEQGLENFNHAIELNPRYEMAYFNRANIYLTLNDYDQALADDDKALELNPQHTDIYNNRGLAYLAKGDFDRAVEDFTHIIQINQDAISHAPATPEEMSQYQVKLALGYDNRGRAYGMKGENDLAEADFDQSIQLEPTAAPLYGHRGDFFLKRRLYDKALADYNRAVQLNPGDAHWFNALAWVLATCPEGGLRNGSLAVQQATRAAELSGWKEPEIMDTLAAAYAEAGDFVKAVNWEKTYLGTAHLSPSDAADGQNRLALYLAYKPYHTD